MNDLIEKVNSAVDKFFSEKEVVIRNAAIYVTIFGYSDNGFARKINLSSSPRMKKEFFDALEEYDKSYMKGE